MLWIRIIARKLVGAVVAVALTLGLFLVLPLLQSITKPPEDLVSVREVAVTQLEAPPEIEEDDPPEEEIKEEIEPPEFEPEEQFLDLNQLDLALSPGLGSGVLAPDTTLNLDNLLGDSGGLSDALDLDSFDQPPRPSFTVGPDMSESMLRALRGGAVRVVIACRVDERGRVTDANIRSSGGQQFDQAALRAVKQWRFDPAQRQGKPVVGLVTIPFDYPKQ